MLERLAGNAAAKTGLQAALRAGRLSHSVLLCGEEGVGAGFAARCLAADWLYPEGGPAAEAVLAGGAPECIEVRGEGASGEIKIDRIREVRREVFNTALSAHGRVVLIYGAQKMKAPSANALLKVLEEPPAGVLFVLTASSAAAVLPTIRSRCVSFALAPLPDAECAALLRKMRPACPETDFLARVFGGKPGSALRCIDDAARRRALESAVNAVKYAAKNDEYSLLALLAGVEKDRPAARLLLADLRCVCGCTLRGQSPALISAPKAARLAREAGEADSLLAANVNAKLVFSCMAARVCREA